MQIVTPILIKEWGITPATMGNVTTIARWIGVIGTFIFPALADLYGRKPILIIAILGYSLFTGLTGFATGWISLLIFTSFNRVALSGEMPVGMVMVSETAPTKWRATALGGLVGGYPFGYMLCSLIALSVVPMWGWQAMYWLGILPALLVLWIRIGIKESPRFERVTATMLKEGLRKRFDILRRRANTRAKCWSRAWCTSSIFSPGSAGRPGCRNSSPSRRSSGSRQWRAISRPGCSPPSLPIGSAVGSAINLAGVMSSRLLRFQRRCCWL
jgi:MFS family permease